MLKDKKTPNEKALLQKWGLLACALIITFCCYTSVFQNQFTGWDDDTYITHDKYITSLSPTNLHALLFKDVTQNYHHPLTMLSLALNYHFSQLNPTSYYFTNLLIHLMNVCAIFFLVVFLLEAMVRSGYEVINGEYWLAALCALWYGIHPMHVESVAWISERKDLLYAFFYFLGMICYIQYIENKKLKWLLFVFACYLLSCLSKPMGVVFPLSLLCIDVLLKRKIQWILLTEKLPLLLLSLALGALAFSTSAKAASVASFNTLTILQRILFPSYGFTMYSLKTVVPFFLSSFYPYPVLTGTLPFIFYLCPFISIAIIGIPLYLSKKAGENYFRVVAFGLGLYLVNLVFVLQFVSVGKTIMADRYSYVSYFGIIFILVYFAFMLMNKKQSFRVPVQILLTCFSLMFAIICTGRTKVWHNSETLWRDVAEKYPLQVGDAYESLANYYFINGNMDSAYNNYKILSGLYTRDPYIFNKLGNISASRQQYDKAIVEFSKSLQIDSTYYLSYTDRANAYSRAGKFDMAILDYTHAYRFEPGNEKLLLNRGAAELNTGDISAAIADFSKILSIDPGNPTALYVLSLAYQKNKDYTNALAYAIKAKQSGYQVSDVYISKLQNASLQDKNK